MESIQTSGRALAFLGDAVWSLVVRRTLLEKTNKGKDLQKDAISYVSAKAQAALYDHLHEEGFFTEEEEEYFKRGRNDHSSTVPKSTPVQVYRKSTGFEAILGMLEMKEDRARILEIWNRAQAIRGE